MSIVQRLIGRADAECPMEGGVRKVVWRRMGRWLRITNYAKQIRRVTASEPN